MESRHSQRVWQPLLTMGLKEHFVLKNTRKLAGRWVLFLRNASWPLCRRAPDLRESFAVRCVGACVRASPGVVENTCPKLNAPTHTPFSMIFEPPCPPSIGCSEQKGNRDAE